jgi:hypothetical protein
MEAKLGIKETKEAVDLVLAVAKIVVEATKDGKVDAQDLGLLIALIPVVQPAVEGANQIAAELKDLEVAEATELAAHVAAKLALPTEKAQAVAQAALKAAVAVFALVKAIKA